MAEEELEKLDKHGKYKTEKLETIAEEIVSSCLPNKIWILSIFMFHM